MHINRKITIAVNLVAVIPLLVIVYLVTNGSRYSVVSRSLILAVTAVIGSLGVIIFMTLMRSLQNLHASVNKIAQGDLSVRMEVVPASGTDDLAISINQLSQKLRLTMDELERRAILIERSNQEFKRMSQGQAAYLADVVHELRTPLIDLEKSSSLLLDNAAGTLSPDQEHFITLMNTNAKRLFRLVNDLLDISKLDAGETLSLQCEFFQVGDAINDAVNSVASWSNSRKVSLQVAIQDELVEVYSDRGRVVQVLVNLLSNAIKFTPAGGAITVDAAMPKPQLVREKAPGFSRRYVQISVRDHGPGIPQDKLELIFQRYKTLPGVSDMAPLSTGLGLPIAKKIIEMLEGQIWVDSVEGQGSTFCFLIPFEMRDERATQHLGKRILVIDDDDIIRQLLTRELNKKGYVVASASDGSEGLQKALEQQYDLVISDVRMPAIDGVSCMEMIRKVAPHTTFIFITGFPLEGRTHEVLKQYSFACISKPFDLPYLFNAVDLSLLAAQKK